jgi:hypothetical protein
MAFLTQLVVLGVGVNIQAIKNRHLIRRIRLLA